MVEAALEGRDVGTVSDEDNVERRVDQRWWVLLIIATRDNPLWVIQFNNFTKLARDKLQRQYDS